MAKNRKQGRPQEQVTAHPETKQPPQRVPGAQSSKVGTKQRDARTAHDKDGNQEQRPHSGRKAS